MQNSMTAVVERFSPIEHRALHDAPEGLARHKFERLRELRAVVETLRCEREARDPLLAWVVDQETAENHRRD